jgi:hypothetical protein
MADLSLEEANRLLIHPGEEPMTAEEWKLQQAFDKWMLERLMRDDKPITREQVQAFIDDFKIKNT